MKKIILVLLILLSFGAFQEAQAKGVIVYHDGPVFKTLKELPADIIMEGKHVNFGVSFEQFGALWLPLWNYSDPKPQYVLVSDDEEYAWSLDAEALAEYKEEFNLDIPDEPSIPLWHKIGLKPVVILLLLLMIKSWLSKKG